MKYELKNNSTRLLRERGVVRSKELENAGMSRMEISRSVAHGDLVRIGRGLYTDPSFEGTEHLTLIMVAVLIPDAVFCLGTALQFHQVTTQNLHEVWIARKNKAHTPRVEYPPLRVVRYSDASLAAGVETHDIGHCEIHVTSLAKTIADCFKYRNRIGLDVAVEALRESLQNNRITPADLWRYAVLDRVANLMRPYLEAMT